MRSRVRLREACATPTTAALRVPSRASQLCDTVKGLILLLTELVDLCSIWEFTIFLSHRVFHSGKPFPPSFLFVIRTPIYGWIDIFCVH